MTFVRIIKKGDKIYKYLYESKRVGNKVISVYKGKVNGKKEVKKDVFKDFNVVLVKLNEFISNGELVSAKECYNILLEEYNKVSSKVNDEEKLKLFNKTKEIYDRLSDLN